MKRFLSAAWRWWKHVGFVIGNAISSLFLFVFYFTVFALFALPYRLSTGGFKAPERTSWVPKGKQLAAAADFENEF